MSVLLEKMKPLVDETVRKLDTKQFDPDPIAGKHLSKIVSVMSSAYKRHGHILTRSILEQLQSSNRYEVWEEPKFYIHDQAEKLVNRIIQKPENVFDKDLEYQSSPKTVKIDFIVHDKVNYNIAAYNIKRGNGLYDSGKKNLLLKDVLLVQILLKSYALFKHLKVNDAKSIIIFYYGKRSVVKPFSLIKEDLDNHFNFPILNEVEKVNEYFKDSLIDMTNKYLTNY